MFVIILVSILIIIIIAIFLIRYYYNYSLQRQPPVVVESSDDIRDIMITDSHLQRLLMIEIIRNDESSINSETVTFSKISTGIALLGKAMIRPFGITVAQRIAVLMQKRNDALREYYRLMRNVVCQNNNCIIVSDDDMESLDITLITNKKLEALTQEITDTIATSFNLRKEGENKYHRIYTLLSMYDKELINQAKSYAFKHYDISMNCSQSTIEISQHITDEFMMFIRERQQQLQTIR